MKDTFLLEKRLWEAKWDLQMKERVDRSCAAAATTVRTRRETVERIRCLFNTSHLLFQWICVSTYYLQGDRHFGPSKGSTCQQIECIPLNSSVNGDPWPAIENAAELIAALGKGTRLTQWQNSESTVMSPSQAHSPRKALTKMNPFECRGVTDHKL